MKLSIEKEKGFTLIEVMITMVIALVVLAGMSSLFVSQSRTAQMLNQKSEVMNDLFLVSQIMQFELRGAKAICWDPAKKRIHYQPLTSDAATDLVAACNTKKKKNGYFQMMPIKVSSGKTSPYIFWKKKDKTNRAELIRNMKYPSGITIIPTVNADLQAVRKITLTSQYRGKNNEIKDVSLSFKVWPRNVQ